MNSRTKDDDCPEIRVLAAGDESLDICRLNDKACIREAGHPCDIYDLFLAEQAAIKSATLQVAHSESPCPHAPGWETVGDTDQAMKDIAEAVQKRAEGKGGN